MDTENKPISTRKTTKVYQPPKIVAELELETRAGSPLGLPDELPDLGN